ncbi:MAG: hypothetical protein U9N48_02820 [Euryarchaeota archaeon]|nr:hypothetical protein [Euryarchaeota archaeon]
MRMQKEEMIVVVLLFMALGSLSVAFWAMGDLDSSGVTVEGTVESIQSTMSGGHLIIRLDSAEMPIFVSSQCGAEMVKDKVQRGDRVEVVGEVSEYHDRDEIVVKGPMDVTVR